MIPRSAACALGMFASAVVGIGGIDGLAAEAANPPKQPTISEGARSALSRMSATLSAAEYFFQARTIRVSANDGGTLLHIAHEFKVTVRKPDRLLVDGTGDDGPRRLLYNGTETVLALDGGKKYARIPVPTTIEGMIQVVVGHFGVDFPLADFLMESPDRAFLKSVTAGREVGMVTMDGIPCRHFIFSQPPGIDLELWLEANDRSLPRRLIVTYRNLPGAPNFIAEMSNWNFSVHPVDAQFEFSPPEGAERVDFTALSTQPLGANK